MKPETEEYLAGRMTLAAFVFFRKYQTYRHHKQNIDPHPPLDYILP
jgi:hypothetical protein